MNNKKSKRVVVGSVVKSKDAKYAPYLKVKQSVTLKEGEYLTLESKKFQLASLEEAEKSGRLSGELVAKMRERIEKTPDFVIGDLVLKQSS